MNNVVGPPDPNVEVGGNKVMSSCAIILAGRFIPLRSSRGKHCSDTLRFI